MLRGAHFAEPVANGPNKVRKQIYTAIQNAVAFLCEVEDLVDMEEITEEMKEKAKGRF